MAVKQMTFVWDQGAINQGKVYIETNGRGIYEASQLVGIYGNQVISETKSGKSGLVIFLNPAVNQIYIEVLDNTKYPLNI